MTRKIVAAHKKSPPNLGGNKFPGMNPTPGPPLPPVPPTVNKVDYDHPGAKPLHGTPGELQKNLTVERPGSGKGSGGTVLTG